MDDSDDDDSGGVLAVELPEPRRAWPSSRRPSRRLFRVALPDEPGMCLEDYLGRDDLLLAGCSAFPPTVGSELAHAATAAHLRHFLTLEDFAAAETLATRPRRSSRRSARNEPEPTARESRAPWWLGRYLPPPLRGYSAL